jgi:two-component system, response regulator YesN
MFDRGLRTRAYQLTTEGWEQSLSERVIEYLEQRYRSPIALRDVAEAFGYSARYLANAFRRSTGLSIADWIVKRRIGAAQRLLGESNGSVAAACEAVGFNDLRSFTRQFLRHAGVTPEDFLLAANDAAPLGNDVQREDLP